jgi:tetratricopeptide (TPR) repeat protein
MSGADADVFTALGVVKSLSRDFLGAASSLEKACSLRSDDPSLWNRLGATLANGGKSHLAREAYGQALRLRPAFARAWSNLGVAHANLGEHNQALRFFLAGLKCAPKAESLWSVVFMTLSNFFPDREDLGQLSSDRKLDELGAALGGIPNGFPVDSGPEETLLRISSELRS